MAFDVYVDRLDAVEEVRGHGEAWLAAAAQWLAAWLSLALAACRHSTTPTSACPCQSATTLATSIMEAKQEATAAVENLSTAVRQQFDAAAAADETARESLSAAISTTMEENAFDDAEARATLSTDISHAMAGQDGEASLCPPSRRSSCLGRLVLAVCPPAWCSTLARPPGARRLHDPGRSPHLRRASGLPLTEALRMDVSSLSSALGSALTTAADNALGDAKDVRRWF